MDTGRRGDKRDWRSRSGSDDEKGYDLDGGLKGDLDDVLEGTM